MYVPEGVDVVFVGVEEDEVVVLVGVGVVVVFVVVGVDEVVPVPYRPAFTAAIATVFPCAASALIAAAFSASVFDVELELVVGVFVVVVLVVGVLFLVASIKGIFVRC